MNQPKLHSGLSAADGDGVNCDQTEQVGMKIHKQLDKVSVIDASIKRNDQVRSLDHLLPGIQVAKKKIHINPTLLSLDLLLLYSERKTWLHSLIIAYHSTNFSLQGQCFAKN